MTQNFKVYISGLFLIVFIVSCNNNKDKEAEKSLVTVDSTFKNTILKQKMDSIFERDQRYRKLTASELLENERYMDSLEEALPPAEFAKTVMKLANNVSEKSADSLMKLQKPLDKLNQGKFLQIMKEYGYPNANLFYQDSDSTGKIQYVAQLTGYILHLLGDENFNNLKPLFFKEVKNGKMPANHYAVWYDRNLYVMGKKQFYGEYNSAFPCVEDLTVTNNARKEIGLEPLKNNNCMDLSKIKMGEGMQLNAK